MVEQLVLVLLLLKAWVLLAVLVALGIEVGLSGGSTWRFGGRWQAAIMLILSCFCSSSICCTSGGAASCLCPLGLGSDM